MPRCFVSTCGNYYSRSNSKPVHYHTFPVSKKLASRWVLACKGRPFSPVPKYARVCSEHFSTSCYKRDLQHELLGLPIRKRLKPDAVPDLNLPRKEEEGIVNSGIRNFSVIKENITIKKDEIKIENQRQINVVNINNSDVKIELQQICEPEESKTVENNFKKPANSLQETTIPILKPINATPSEEIKKRKYKTSQNNDKGPKKRIYRKNNSNMLLRNRDKVVYAVVRKRKKEKTDQITEEKCSGASKKIMPKLINKNDLQQIKDNIKVLNEAKKKDKNNKIETNKNKKVKTDISEQNNELKHNNMKKVPDMKKINKNIRKTPKLIESKVTKVETSKLNLKKNNTAISKEQTQNLNEQNSTENVIKNENKAQICLNNDITLQKQQNLSKTKKDSTNNLDENSTEKYQKESKNRFTTNVHYVFDKNELISNKNRFIFEQIHHENILKQNSTETNKILPNHYLAHVIEKSQMSLEKSPKKTKDVNFLELLENLDRQRTAYLETIDQKLPVRSSIRIAKKKSIEHTSGPGIEPKSPRSKEINEKVKFMAKFNLKLGFNPGKELNYCEILKNRLETDRKNCGNEKKEDSSGAVVPKNFDSR